VKKKSHHLKLAKSSLLWFRSRHRPALEKLLTGHPAGGNNILIKEKKGSSTSVQDLNAQYAISLQKTS